MRTAVYAGSFDPLTMGHMNGVIMSGVKIFDSLVIAVGNDPRKKYTFSEEHRLAMVVASVASLPVSNIRAAYLGNQFLVDFARRKDINAQFLLRGIRDATDYEAEVKMRDENKKRAPEIETVFVFPDEDLRRVSSSFVKSLVGPDGWEDWVKDYLPPSVFTEFVRRFSK